MQQTRRSSRSATVRRLSALAAAAAVLGVAVEAREAQPVAIGPTAAEQVIQLSPGGGEPFRDCDFCPQMVLVPAAAEAEGAVIGSPEDEPGRVAGETRMVVRVAAFAIGRLEVTVGEYMRCVAAGACRHPEWAEPGGEHNLDTGSGVTYRSIAASVRGDTQPVVGISWDDANAYTAWLAKVTGRAYRLPSDAEWEYAARAGSTSAYWWGGEPTLSGRAMACCRGCGSQRDGTGIFSADSFDANPWGLKNVHGNVWEWVADYFCEDRATAASDGSARTEPACPPQSAPEGLRIFRGGSCFFEPRQMRAAMRLRNWPSFRNMTLGFRVARSLSP